MWIMKKDELARMRKARDMTVQQLADRSGVHRRTIEKIESGEQLRVKGKTIEDLAAALKCTMNVLGTLEDEDHLLPDTPGPAVSPWESVARTGSDTKQAQREQQRGIARPTIDWEGREIPIMSYSKQKQCELLYTVLADDTFAACGKIRHYDTMPREVAQVLKAEVGGGASYFVIRREIPRLGPQRGPEYLRERWSSCRRNSIARSCCATTSKARRSPCSCGWSCWSRRVTGRDFRRSIRRRHFARGHSYQSGLRSGACSSKRISSRLTPNSARIRRRISLQLQNEFFEQFGLARIVQQTREN